MLKGGSIYAQCGNLHMFLPLIFYVKSIVVNSKSHKRSFLAILEALNVDYRKFLHFFNAQI